MAFDDITVDEHGVASREVIRNTVLAADERHVGHGRNSHAEAVLS
jgi:hypothetical protein